MQPREDALFLSPWSFTPHIMHRINYLLGFVRRSQHFLQEHNQRKKQGSV